MNQYIGSIGEAAAAVGIAPDTLRYYEKIHLLPRPARNAGGRRTYRERDLARLRFIKRAQALGFSLHDIGELLKLREDPVKCSKAVRTLAAQKRDVLEAQLRETERMHRELSLLLNLCRGAADHCPILERMEGGEPRPPERG